MIIPRFGCPFVAVLLAATPASGQGPTPIGVWLHPNGRIHVAIAPCGDRMCGKLVWFRRPNDAQGLPLVDFRNSDPNLRARPLLGLTILRGLRRTGDRSWGHGRIYNPDDGLDYRARMTMQADGTLTVRAYVIVPQLGKTFSWRRVR